MFKKGKGLLVLTLLVVFASIIIAGAQEVPIAKSFRFPLDGDWSPLLQDFNKWNNMWNGYHLGEDVGREDADKKNYAVYPMADGIVKFADVVMGYTVLIEHKLSDNDPDGDSVCSVYYHMKRPGEGEIKLTLGEIVSMDSPIGYISGKWEDHKSSPHLHFGIRKGRYETGKDPRTGFWYYPGYTVIKKDGEVQKNPDDPIHNQILADWFNPSTDPKNGTGFIERHITQIGQITEISSSKNYFPLDEGRRWEYQTYFISQHGIGDLDIGPGSKISGKRVCSKFPQRELEGKKVTPIQIEDKIRDSVRTSFGFYVKDQNGIYQFAHQEPEDAEPKISHFYEIKYPIKVGNNWQETLTSSPIEVVYHFYREPGISIPVKVTIESIDDVVTVPAGTFKECLKIKYIGFAEKVFGEKPLENNVKVECYIENWYAPNVGLIKSIFKEKKTIGTIISTEFDLFESIMQLETFK